MTIEIKKQEVIKLLKKQLDSNFILTSNESHLIDKYINNVLQKLEYNFKFNTNKYYKKDDQVYFNPYHSGQYTVFLYLMSREIYLLTENTVLSDKIYYLNKMMNQLDLFYEVEMPDIFFLDHPLGSVIGRATYGSHFSFSQQCTVGNNRGIYPKISDNVMMMSGAKILGDCNIGKNCIMSANAYIKDTDIQENCIVFGQSPNLIIKKRKDIIVE